VGTEADPRIDGYLASIIDEDWVNSELPLEDIYVPLGDLPDQEQESGKPKETIQELEKKWKDDGLQSLLKRLK